MRPDSDSPTAVVLTSVFLSPGTRRIAPGGSARVTLDLVRLLRSSGFQVRVIQKGPRDETVTMDDGLPVEIVQARVRSGSDLWFAFRTRRAASRASVCCYATPEIGFPFYASRGFAVQHGIWWDGPAYRGIYGSFVRGVQWLRNVSMCQRLRAVLCVDTNFINYLRTGGAPGRAVARCRYVPNYVDLDAAPEVRAADLSRRHRARRLLFLRRCEEQRGPGLFLEVCERLRARNIEFSAKMIGAGSQQERIRRLIAEKRLDRVVELDSRGLDEVYGLINECSVSVVPSLWSEGTSLAAVESVALGVPVVATDVGGLGNVVIPHFNGFVTGADASSMAYYVERLLEDETLYLRMSERCLTMREAFSRARWCGSILRILDEVGLIPPDREAVPRSVAAVVDQRLETLGR